MMMRRERAALVSALLGVAVALVAAAPAGAVAKSAQTFDGVIVALGASGMRVVISSVVVGRGAFTGAGRVVEVDNLPNDPDNVSRDDLVFPGGTMHLVSVTVDASFSIDPRTCVFTVAVTQTQTIQGGTGKFAAASGASTGSVRAHGLAARDPDGSCSQEQLPLLEVDAFASTGTLSF